MGRWGGVPALLSPRVNLRRDPQAYTLSLELLAQDVRRKTLQGIGWGVVRMGGGGRMRMGKSPSTLFRLDGRRLGHANAPLPQPEVLGPVRYGPVPPIGILRSGGPDAGVLLGTGPDGGSLPSR